MTFLPTNASYARRSARRELHEPVNHRVHQRGPREVRDVGLRVLGALGVPHDVRRAQHRRHDADEKILQVEPGERDRRERDPRYRGQVQRVPEQRTLARVHQLHALRVPRLKPPRRHARVVDLVPVPQAHQQAPADVLRDPEVPRQEQHARHEVEHEVRLEPLARHVRHQRGELERDVAERRHGVPLRRRRGGRRRGHAADFARTRE
mmetsp:Transcript_3335/g.14007  ORF Transcript_3335/g.14007 Transcript_3335/m.14007 type:complete len:207 (+) Transcript_3335:53-673(+)